MLKRARAVLALALLAANAAAATGGAAPTAVPGVAVPMGEIVEDRTPEMWSVRWWMWAASFRGEESPVTDRKGTRCGAGQEGDTFLLAGGYGSDPVRRTCTVPRGKNVFFPLVTYIVMSEGGRDCDPLKWEARAMTDKPVSLFAELDGMPIEGVESRRASSGKCFNVNARSHGPNVPAAADGYWLMLRPLAPGRHTLHFGGELASLSQDITYTLLVQ
jgi:hypothetical protein